MNQTSILIVQENAEEAQKLRRRVAALGYNASGLASSGAKAVERARSLRPDLVLMEVRLTAGGDGIEAACRIRDELDIPVVFLSENADEETVARAEQTEPFGYLFQPFAQQELKTAIRIGLYKHKTDQALRSREELLKTLFEAMPNSMVLVNAEFQVLLLNRKAQETFQIEAGTDRICQLGDVLRCVNAFEGGCGTSEGCKSCCVRRAVEAAMAGQRIQQRRCQFAFQTGASLRQLELLVNAAAFEHRGQRLAILIMENSTELMQLRRLLAGERSFAGIVGTSPKIQRVFETIRDIADVDVPVLIQGETGTGKELVARAIHDRGSRADRPFVAVNCGAIPDDLLESELFGHVKGAFTGAVRDRKGRFTLADHGTIFLDEIGDLSLAVQVKMLRVLQESTFQPVGSDSTVEVDVRIISATNKDLLQEVKQGRFRMDLYYRLCVVPLDVPPLRERLTDIPLIAEHLLARDAAASGRQPTQLSNEVQSQLLEHPWPGNVRELQNVLQFASIKSHGAQIELEHLPPSFRADQSPREMILPPQISQRLSIESVEAALRQTQGNRTAAARLLGVSRATLYRFLAKNR